MELTSPYRTVESLAANPIVVTTGTDVPEHRVVEILGVVHGAAQRAQPEVLRKTPKQAIDARKLALAGLIEEAASVRADAVIGLRYDCNEEDVVAYGTAVRLDRVK